MARQAHASKKNLQTGARVALLGFVANVMLAFAKILAGFFGHAYVLIADGIESTLDVGGSIVHDLRTRRIRTVTARPSQLLRSWSHSAY